LEGGAKGWLYDPGPPSSEVRKSFVGLSRAFHPDKGGDAALFLKIQVGGRLGAASTGRDCLFARTRARNQAHSRALSVP